MLLPEHDDREPERGAQAMKLLERACRLDTTPFARASLAAITDGQDQEAIRLIKEGMDPITALKHDILMFFHDRG